jgi:hypothetical protein
MKQFLIRYRRTTATAEAWHEDIKRFIAQIEADPELRGRLAYRCMKVHDSDEYLHLATPTDDAVVKALQSRDWFNRYNEQTRAAAGGSVEVLPLEIVAETAPA